MAQIKPTKHEVAAEINYIWATATEEEAEAILEYKRLEGKDENTSD